jgi:parvulin-like peptidyl-prolyl isomerase
MQDIQQVHKIINNIKEKNNMASKLNTEFNYRYQVIGDTPWEKIKTLQGFLEGRIRAAALEEVGNLKDQAKVAKLKHLEKMVDWFTT